MKWLRFIYVIVFLLYGTIFLGQDRSAVIESVNDSGGQKYAFLVGVSEYENSMNFPTLSYTVSDVKAWQDQLETMGFPSRNIVVMASNTSVSRQPTNRKILSSLQELLSKVSKDDIVICMFSGHGTQIGADQYFCPEDAQVADLVESCVPLKEVFSALKNSKAKFKWLIIDACRNDPTKSMDSGVKSLGKVEDVPKGVTAIFSCADTEKSYEDPTLGLGVFTNFLMKGLSGEATDKNGVITILDLYKYVHDQTQIFVKAKHNQSQVPYWDGEFTNFTIRDDLLIEGVSRLKWNEAQDAYQLAIGCRHNKDYAKADLEIKKSLSILPNKREYLDEQALIESIKATIVRMENSVPVPAVKKDETPSDVTMPEAIDLDNPENLIAPLRELKRDKIKPVVDTARHLALVFFADATQDEKFYTQATKDFFTCLVPNFRKGNDRIEWVEEIFPIMVRRQNFDGLKECTDEIVTDMVKNEKDAWVRNCASLAGFALAQGDGVAAKDRKDAADYSGNLVVKLAAAIANKRMMVKDYKVLVDNFPMLDYSAETGWNTSQRATRDALASTREIRWGDRLSFPDEMSSSDHAFRVTVVWLAKYGKKEEYYKFLELANKTYNRSSLDLWAWYFAQAEAILGDFDRARNHWMQYPTSGTGPYSHILLSLIVRREFLVGEFKGWETMQRDKNKIENLRGVVYKGHDMSAEVSLFYFDYGRGMARHKTDREIQSEYATLLSGINNEDLTFFMAGVATGLQDRKNPITTIVASSVQTEEEKLADEVVRLIGEINVKMNLRYRIEQDGTLVILTNSSGRGLQPYTGQKHITSIAPSGTRIAVTVTPAMIGEFKKGMEYYTKEDMPNAKRCLEKALTMFAPELERALKGGR